MTQFLIRRFIRHPNDPQDPATRTAYGNLASGVGMACNLLRKHVKIEPERWYYHLSLIHIFWVGICGELGADTALTETFLRMGVDELSMNAKSVLPVRKIIRSIDLSKPSDK